MRRESRVSHGKASGNGKEEVLDARTYQTPPSQVNRLLAYPVAQERLLPSSPLCDTLSSMGNTEKATALRCGRYRPSLVEQAEQAWRSMGRRKSWAAMTSHALEAMVGKRSEPFVGEARER